MSGTEKGKVTVCVTGASGFIGSYLVKLLLLRGYIVHATVRDPNDGTKTDHLKALEGAREQLRLFKADLREEGSFDSAIAGCQGVFHTASPVNFNVSDERANELVLEPAVKGTLNVLSACKRTPSVRRVIFTSSMSAVLFAGKPLTHNTVVDETWFSDPQHCNVLGPLKWYVTSKIMAEEAAWKFSKENGIDMISMNPGSVIGPILQPTLNDSTAMFSNIIGAETYPNICLFPIHVEDVAEAHIRAFEIPSAQGRYCIVERSIHFSEIVKLLQELYPTLQFPKSNNICCLELWFRRAENEVLWQPCQVSKAKAESLGISYIPAEVSLKETIESLIEKKFIHL